IGDPVLAERAADVRQVGRRAAALVSAPVGAHAGSANGAGSGSGGGKILVAEELGPADVLGMEEGEIVAAAAVKGGPNAHAGVPRTPRAGVVPPPSGSRRWPGPARAVPGAGGAGGLVGGGAPGSRPAAPGEGGLPAPQRARGAAPRRRTALAAERDLPSETTD